MGTLQRFMQRMHYLERPSPLRTGPRRRRYSSSASNSIYITITDPNNNELLPPIVNPTRKDCKVSAIVYKTHPLAVKDDPERSSQLAVHVFEGLDLKIRSEPPHPVSIEKFLSFRSSVGGSMGEETAVISGVFNVPRMVPVSRVDTTYPCYNVETGEATIVHCTTVEFRRRYFPAARQTINQEQQEVDREPPEYVSYACWIVSEFEE